MLQGDKPVITILVNNPSAFFSYPVPQMFLNVFDSTGTYIGSLSSHYLQWINKNSVSVLSATILPNYDSLALLLQGLLNSKISISTFTINGVLKISGIEYVIDTEIKTGIDLTNQLLNFNYGH